MRLGRLVWAGAFLFAACGPQDIWDAKKMGDNVKACESRARDPQFPQEALVAEFDKVNRKAGLDKDPEFSASAVARNFSLMSDADARAMLWSICAATKGGGNCDDPQQRVDGSFEPPRNCRFRKGNLMTEVANPFLA